MFDLTLVLVYGGVAAFLKVLDLLGRLFALLFGW